MKQITKLKRMLVRAQLFVVSERTLLLPSSPAVVKEGPRPDIDVESNEAGSGGSANQSDTERTAESRHSVSDG